MPHKSVAAPCGGNVLPPSPARSSLVLGSCTMNKQAAGLSACRISKGRRFYARLAIRRKRNLPFAHIAHGNQPTNAELKPQNKQPTGILEYPSGFSRVGNKYINSKKGNRMVPLLIMYFLTLKTAPDCSYPARKRSFRPDTASSRGASAAWKPEWWGKRAASARFSPPRTSPHGARRRRWTCTA